MKTFISLLTAAVLVAALASPAAAKDAHGDGEVDLLTRETAAVTAGDTVWLALNWTADDGPVSDFSLVLRKEPKYGVEVSYPENTATYTGLMNGHQLDEGEVDFTAFQVHVPSTVDKKKVDLEFEVSWTTGDGERESDKIKIKVPVVQWVEGEHLVQHESATVLAPGSSAWVDVDFSGLAPMVDDLRLTIDGDLPVVYPAYGTSTSLDGDHQLDDGETDTARFRVDAGDTPPGSYELPTEVSYTYGGSTHVRPGVVKVVIGS